MQRIAGYAEEDAFFVFTNLMAEFRDLYCVAADNSNFGINVRSHSTAAALVAVALWTNRAHFCGRMLYAPRHWPGTGPALARQALLQWIVDRFGFDIQ